MENKLTKPTPIILHKKIYFLTSNMNKLIELIEIGKNFGLAELVGSFKLELEEIQCNDDKNLKNGSEEISKNKIIIAIKKIKDMVKNGEIKFTQEEVIIVCDDTSLFLNGTSNYFPGPFIKYMKPQDLIIFANAYGNENSAEVSTLFSYIIYKNSVENYELKDVNICIGSTIGKISSEQRGTNGFGFDNCFIPIESEFSNSDFFNEYCSKNNKFDNSSVYGKTFSELDKDVKNCVSQRTKACNLLFNELSTVINNK